jgi:hypothetical protein
MRPHPQGQVHNGVAIGNWQLAIGERQRLKATMNGGKQRRTAEVRCHHVVAFRRYAVVFRRCQLPVANCQLPSRYG